MPANVLVVDDSLAMRKLVCAVVEEIGHHAIPAKDGEEALREFAAHAIDLVVLDVQMPGMDGFEVCRTLRKRATRGWFPVVYLSASHSDEYIVEGLDAGGDAYVRKPLNPRVLESMIGAMGRIAEMKRALDEANASLEKQATLDGLTGLFNRRAFDRAIDRLVRYARREKAPLSVLMLDVDHFKRFNDTYGHLEGDECLRKIGGALHEAARRPLDVAARYGGEEFSLLLPRTDLEGARVVAERLLDEVRGAAIPHTASDTAAFVTVSVGVATYVEGDTPASLLARADSALYSAKETGRNRAVFADAPTD